MYQRAKQDEIEVLLNEKSSMFAPECGIVARALTDTFHIYHRAQEEKPEPRRTRRSFGFEECGRLIALWQEGNLSVHEIAEELNRPYHSVWGRIRVLRAAGELPERNAPTIVKERKMTKRQKDTLDFIRQYWADFGYAPTYDAIAAGVGLRSKGGVARLINALEERGYVKRFPNRARSVRLVENQAV